MKAKNPSVINQECQKYVNDIVKKVYKIPAHSIKTFSPDLSATPTTNGSDVIENDFTTGKFSFRSLLNGIPYYVIFLLKNYLALFRQTKIERTYKMPLMATKVVGGTFSGSGVMAPITITGYSNLNIEVPDGYDGNLSFVKVVIDPDYQDVSLSTGVKKTIVDNLQALSPNTTRTFDALLYYAPRLKAGSWSIDVAKSTKSIMVTVDATGFEDKGAVDFDHSLVVRVIYFKRGVK